MRVNFFSSPPTILLKTDLPILLIDPHQHLDPRYSNNHLKLLLFLVTNEVKLERK
jgi:hypothetical protein